MQVSELEQIITQLIRDVTALRAELDEIKLSNRPSMPEWISLREACEFTGVSTHRTLLNRQTVCMSKALKRASIT